MKPNSSNSFRLQRVSRASSLKKHSQTFYQPDESFKLAAINSVSRGVKYNDASLLMGDNLNKLRKEPLENKDQMYQTSHEGLAGIRKKYDEMKKQRVKMDEQIYRLKEQINKYTIFENEYKGKIAKGQEMVKNLKKALVEKKDLLEVTLMEKKVLESVRHRHKEDKVVYDQRKFDLEKEQSFQKKQLSLFLKDGVEINEMGDRTDKIYKAFLNQLKQEQNQREQHLVNLQKMISQRDHHQQHNIERGQQINEIAERAMQDKDPNEKQWHKIYLTQHFVSKMLRDKIDREMMKFATVEMAFMTIKTATGINDVETLVEKYLKKEQAYGELLGRITMNEKKIVQLKQEQEELVKQQRELELEKDTYKDIKLKAVDVTYQMNQMQVAEKNRTTVQSLFNDLKIWGNKQNKKFRMIDPLRAEEYPWDKNQPLQSGVINILKHISALLDQCIKDENQDQTEAGDLSARDSARVTRVMPKKSRKNSAGQQIFDVEEEEVPMGADEEEGDLIDTQRQQLLRNNERFMKEARQRMQEKRKAILEAKATKEKEKKVEVKKDDQ